MVQTLAEGSQVLQLEQEQERKNGTVPTSAGKHGNRVRARKYHDGAKPCAAQQNPNTAGTHVAGVPPNHHTVRLEGTLGERAPLFSWVALLNGTRT